MMVLLAATGASAKFGIGVRGGIGAAYANYQRNFSTLVATEVKTSGVALAAHAGLAVNIGLPAGFEMESGAQFALLGSRIKTQSFLGETTWNRSIYTIQIPVRAGWHYTFGNLVGIYAQVGPQFTVAMGGKDATTGKNKLVELKTDRSLEFGDDANRRILIDLSIHAGASIGNFRVGGYYDLGLLNMSASDELSYKPSSAGISLAYFLSF